MNALTEYEGKLLTLASLKVYLDTWYSNYDHTHRNKPCTRLQKLTAKLVGLRKGTQDLQFQGNGNILFYAVLGGLPAYICGCYRVRCFVCCWASPGTLYGHTERSPCCHNADHVHQTTGHLETFYDSNRAAGDIYTEGAFDVSFDTSFCSPREPGFISNVHRRGIEPYTQAFLTALPPIYIRIHGNG